MLHEVLEPHIEPTKRRRTCAESALKAAFGPFHASIYAIWRAPAQPGT
jgi:hypothetical protein